MPSFDITSEVDLVNLRNAVEGANRKITGRYDFKGSNAKIEQKEHELTLDGQSDFQLEQMLALLLPEMTSKQIDIRCLEYGDVEKSGGNRVMQKLTVRVGVEQALSKRIVAMIKEGKFKVQASIQGDSLRVTGAKRDDLQAAMAMVKAEIKDYPLQFGNFRN